MSNRIVKAILSPILLLQGFFVYRTIMQLPEPLGDREGTKGEGKKLRLLVLGDSAAVGVGAEHQKEALLGNLVSCLSSKYALDWKLVAKTGATTSSTIRHLQKLAAEKFDVVVVSLGVNDVTANKSQSAFLDEQQQLIDILRDKFSVEQIIVSGFPPVYKFPALPQPLRWFLGRRSIQFDSALRQLAAQNRIDYFEQRLDFISLNDRDSIANWMASDGFHPGPKIYKIWGDEVGKVIANHH